ncbi:cytochrome P450 [Streptomyces lavendulae]|uniref:cytochrome P450 n=1 Tax=Streptomyces lavendulae TaxID=1914 RepID=UPI00142D2CB1|nr:cytochrome P450 [Streptomyces lavendulae]
MSSRDLATMRPIAVGQSLSTRRPPSRTSGRVDFFYDERHVLRHSALPGPVLDTLFGRGAVHTLDGQAHRIRKELFTSHLMTPDGVQALGRVAREHWLRTADGLRGRSAVLFDEMAVALAGAVCEWSGVPCAPGAAVRRPAEDCVTMVDGFATPGPRHWKARRARTRQEHDLARTINDTRGHTAPTCGDKQHSVLDAVATHRDADGSLLDLHTGAVELLNVLRPTVAITWFTTFAAHALHRFPAVREQLRADGGAYARAFAHEVRRCYPFVPFVGGLAARDLHSVPKRCLEARWSSSTCTATIATRPCGPTRNASTRAASSAGTPVLAS